MFALETLVILTILRAAYSNFAFMLELDTAYYAKKGNKIVVLLCAGSKRSQDRDIAKAKKYWEDLGG